MQKIKAVETYDFDNKKVKYSDKIKGWKIDKFKGDEEIVRAYILVKLVNELGYELENIELEKQYDIGRPKVNKPRIDIIVRDDMGNAFLYIELKSPQDYEKDKDDVIEKQIQKLLDTKKANETNEHKPAPIKANVRLTISENSIFAWERCWSAKKCRKPINYCAFCSMTESENAQSFQA